MAFDSSSGQLILFGGVDGGVSLSDTWNWDGSNWNQLTPITSPSARSSASMAFDSSSGQLILFGGFDGTVALNDTWNWDGSNWNQLTPITSPLARQDHSMAFDSSTEQLILFGGINISVFFSDTWNWNGNNWTLLTPTSSPSARTQASMAFDAAKGQLILFGGISKLSRLNETWNWGLPQPTVAVVSPNIGSTSGGESVTITGTNFLCSAVVNFGANPATQVVIDSPTQITVISPPGTGTVNVTVTTPGGGTSVITPSDEFTYVAAPTVNGISPNSGPTSGGTSVIITGTNFTGATSILFGGNPASFTVNSSTQITAISPPGTGTVNVTVTTANGTSAITSFTQFTYIPLVTVFPPKNVKGHQVKNRFATQTDIVNIITWQAPSEGTRPVAYKIFKDAALTQLIEVVPAHDQDRFKFEQHQRRKNRTYTYYLVSVDAAGNQSSAIPVTIKPKDG